MKDIDSLIFFFSYYNIKLLLAIILVGIVNAYLLRKNRIFLFVVLLIILGFSYIPIAFAGGGIAEYFFCFFLPTSAISLLFVYVFDNLIIDSKKGKMNPPYNVPLRTVKGKTEYISDANRGVSITGSSGSGKTAGPITSILTHFANEKFAGIIHDYKNYELTEVAYPLFKRHGIDFKIFAPHDVNRSVRINVVSPHIIDTETKLNGIIKTLVLNLEQESAGGDTKFFRDGVESLISAVVWRLKKDYPEKCNLPFTLALLLCAQNHHEKIEQEHGMILIKPYQKLIDFICQDTRAEILGSVFLTGVSNERQTGSLYSTLAACLRQLATPELFYLLSGHELDLDINSDNNRQVLSFINKPGYFEKTISPVNAMLMQATFAEMSERGRKPSFAVIDEAPTIKMEDLPSQIRTLRSFGVSFTYCLQDKIAGVAQYGGKEYKIKDILANLSTQFVGKVNDADTAKYYERFFEIIKEERISKSYSNSIFNTRDEGSRITQSTQDKSKTQGYEIFRLEQGEFIMFNDGYDKRFKFYYKEPEKALPPPLRSITPTELENNYINILEEAKNFFNNKINPKIITQ